MRRCDQETATTGTSTTTSSAGTSGGTMTLSGSAAQTIASAYYSFGRYRRDGGIDKGTVIMFGGTNSVSCAEFSSDAGVPKGLDGHVLELAVLNKSADVQAGTYPVGEFISVILGNADGGAALAVGVHSFVDGGGALEYDATQGSLTISNPDGVSDLTGSFSTQAVQDGGTTADISGSFDLPYCQSAH